MREDKELWDRFGDLLQETPEAEEALKKWRDRRERECRLAILGQLRKRREQELAESLRWFSERMKTLPK